jgi:hypothetical protein
MSTNGKIGGTPPGPTRQHYRLATGQSVNEMQSQTATTANKKSMGGLAALKQPKGKK